MERNEEKETPYRRNPAHQRPSAWENRACSVMPCQFESARAPVAPKCWGREADRVQAEKWEKTATRAGFVPSQRSPIEATKLTATRGPFWAAGVRHCHVAPVHDMDQHRRSPHLIDRKSTRLNSS